MAPQTEFQRLVGLIRARDELAPLRHVPLDGLRQAVNEMVGAQVPEGEIEVVAQDLRQALEVWLPLRRALEGWQPAAPVGHVSRGREAVPSDMPRAGFVAAACERPSMLSAAPAGEPVSSIRARSGWRWPLLLFWAAFIGGAALALHAAGWSPATALTELSAALSDILDRALSGDRLSFGAALAAVGLLGVALTNLWALLLPSRLADA